MKLKNKKSLIFIVLVFVVFLVLGSFAYLLSTDTFENIFSAGIYKTVTREVFQSPTNWTPGDETPKTITTKNEGTIPVRVRVKLDESWTSRNNETLSLEYNNEKVAIINLDNQNDWLYKDEYYYYTKELAPGESTESLLKSVTFNPNVEADVICTFENGVNTCESTGNGYDGATYRLNITTETVQANKYDKVWENVPIMYDYVGDNPCTFDGELIPGAEYVNGQYTYRYRQEKDYVDWRNITDDGWGVALTDKESTEPVTTTLCSSINNKPIVSMLYMFSYSKASSIDLSYFDTSNVTEMAAMFSGIKATSLDLSAFDTSKVTNMNGMFSSSEVNNLDLSNFDTSNVTNISHMFSWSKATNISLSGFDTSNVTDMHSLFEYSNATSINLSSFDTSNVIDMSYFFNSSKATTLDLSTFDTSSVTNMDYMFYGSNAATLNISSFNTSNVVSMSNMFSYSKATSIDLSSFNTSNVTNMYSMFNGSKATTLDLSSFDTSNVTNMDLMFCNAEATIGYGKTQADCDRFNSSKWKTSGLTFVVK
ncbi:MAG: BsaA family SipW-dependent biofilm matrix protein [Bacilli bacterium]|nr:BsaA family SipW-dependent biofilm matrix protein [Bacilli bacterium]